MESDPSRAAENDKICMEVCRLSGRFLCFFEIYEQYTSARLRLMHEIHKCFSEDIPEFSRENCIEGWNFLIQKRLKEFLEKSTSRISKEK